MAYVRGSTVYFPGSNTFSDDSNYVINQNHHIATFAKGRKSPEYFTNVSVVNVGGKTKITVSGTPQFPQIVEIQLFYFPLSFFGDDNKFLVRYTFWKVTKVSVDRQSNTFVLDVEEADSFINAPSDYEYSRKYGYKKIDLKLFHGNTLRQLKWADSYQIFVRA